MTPERAQRFLRELDRDDLASLLEFTTYAVYVDEGTAWIPQTYLVLHAPEPYAEAMKGLNDYDRKRLLEAFEKTDAAAKADTLSIEPDTERELQPEQKIFGELIAERNMLISVGTGGARIQEVDDYYRARRKRLRALLAAVGLDDPNPYASLWDWYKAWPGTYAERRSIVRTMYGNALEKLGSKPMSPVPAREPTGWTRVDRAVDKARARLEGGATEEDFQGVGLLCREVLISLAQAVFDASRHKILDDVKASNTDAKRMLEAYFAVELAGGDHEATRKHARAALDLAVALQHKRTADFRLAALCLEATSSVVNIVAIVSGRRDRSESIDVAAKTEVAQAPFDVK